MPKGKARNKFGLTDKQAAFVAEYLVDMNAAGAARRAGYSNHSIKANTNTLMSNPAIKAAIEHAQEERAERLGITADMVLAQLAKIGFGDIREIFGPEGELLHPRNLSDAAAARVSSIKVATKVVPGSRGEDVERVVEINCESQLGALNAMARHLGMFKDKGDSPNTVVLNISKDDAAL